MKKRLPKEFPAMSIVRIHLILTIVLMLLALPLGAFASETVQASEAWQGREKLNFNQGWKFVRGEIREAIEVDYPMEELERWESVNLPHTVREEPYLNSGGINYQGPAMYRKHFALPESYQGKKLFLEFEGAMGVTDVWVNGEHLQSKMAAKTGENTQYGGYLPFILDVTDAVHCDGEYNVIIVLTDNSDNLTVPPGKPQSQLDFTYFGGLYRNVWLEVTEQVHITNAVYEDITAGGGILVEYPRVSEESADVSVKTHVRNQGAEAKTVTLRTEIADADGNVVKTEESVSTLEANSDTSFSQKLTVENPRLWNLDTPYLYRLISTVLIDGEEVDRQETKIGIRRITMNKDTGLMINGKSAGFLSGVNRHQEYPYVGYAASSSMQRRDALKFKSAGFNIVRTSHSVQSVDFIEACDELGILVMECVPGWQHWSDAPEFAARVKNDIRQMVRRTRNHPSILCYEISLNETVNMPSDLKLAFPNECSDIAREEYPQAYTSAENPRKGANADILYGTPDEVAGWSDTAMSLIREYADYWDEQNGNFKDLARVTRGPGTFYPGGEGAMVKQAMNKLWNGYTFVGTGGISLSEGIKNYVTSNKRFLGVTMWIGIDHNRGYHQTMSPCGLWDLRRIPKYSYYAFESQRSLKENEFLELKGVETGPSMFIASSWGEKAPVVDKTNEKIGTDSSREIQVYSNTSRVRLSVMGENGESLWTATQDPIDRKTAGYLDHPPYIFEEVPYRAGSWLKAEGLDESGKVLITREVRTAGEPAKLRIEVDSCGMDLTADGSDQVMVYASVLDKDGNLCQEADNRLYFSAEGEAQIVGDADRRVGSNPVEAEAGIMGILLQSTQKAGKVKLKVQAEGLEAAEVTIETKPMTGKTVSYEHIAQGPSLEYRSMYLTEKEERIEGEDAPSIEKTDLTIGGEAYENSIEAKNMLHIEYDLAGKYSRFTAGAALESPEQSPNGAVFLVYTDGTLRYVSPPVKDGIQQISVDVSGCERLTLVAEDVSGINTGKMRWLSPYVYEGTTPEDESELKENLASGKTASATSADPGAGAENAVDGSMDTLWRSKEAVAEGKPQSWTVDLGETVDVRNGKIAVEQDYLLCTYRIYTSEDGKQWEQRAEGSKTAHGNDVEDTFRAENVRYVKVEFIKVESTQGGEDGREPKASVKEFEIYPDRGVDTVRDYNLKGLEIGGRKFAFSPSQTEYVLTQEEYGEEFCVKALPANPESSIKINGTEVKASLETDLDQVEYQAVQLNENGEIQVEVTSPDGQGKKVYYFRFEPGESQGVYDAAKCFVRGVNGANQWSYQTWNKEEKKMEDMEDSSGGYVQGEYAWLGDGQWIYSGPRYMHSTPQLNAVRTFTAPRDGMISCQSRIEKFTGQPGQVSLALWKDGEKIWPQDQDGQTVSQGEVLEFDLPLQVKAGEQIQWVMDSAGANGGDATGVLTTVRYLNQIDIAQAQIFGNAYLLRKGNTPLQADYRVEAKLESGQVIEGLDYEWQVKAPENGVSVSSDGALSVTAPGEVSEIVLQALYQDRIIAEKTIRILEAEEEAYLSDLEWKSAECGDNRQVQKDHSVGGDAIRLTGSQQEAVVYKKGLGIHAPSRIVYDISGQGYSVFHAMVGVDYSQNPDGFHAAMSFKVYFDGKEDQPAYDSGEMKYNTPQKEICIPIPEGTQTITLEVEEGQVTWSDHGDWADAKFVKTGRADTAALKELVSLANQKDTQGYEEELVRRFEEALAAAEEILAEPLATQKETDEAFGALQSVYEEMLRLDEQERLDREAADMVMKLIEGIGEISLESGDVLREAQEAYEKLTETQKSLVTNLAVLEEAQKRYEILVREEEEYQKNLEAAEAVERKILDIGIVTLEKGELIREAREAYDALTETQKEMVGILSVLENAESYYESLTMIQIDTEILRTAIAAAEGLREEDYTPESFSLVKAALEKARNVNPESQEDINRAAAELIEAICGLKEKKEEPLQQEKADLEKLKELVAQAEAVDWKGYTAATVQTLDYVTAAARELILSNPGRELQSLAERMEQALREAIENLQPVSSPTIQSPSEEPSDNKGLVRGETFRSGKLVYRITSAEKREAAVVRPSKKTNKVIRIPDTVKLRGIVCRVTSIEKKAFRKNGKLKKVTIGRNIRTIGKQAFYGDKKLKNLVILSKKLTEAHSSSLKGISARAVVDVPKGKEKRYRELFQLKKTIKMK